MFNNYEYQNEYLVLIIESDSDLPLQFRTTSNLYIANIIVNDYFASVLIHNSDAELIENEVSTHPDMVKSWRLEFRCDKPISIGIYKVKNVEIKN